MNQRMSDYLFEMDKEALKDTNRTNHAHRAHKANPDPMVVVKWFLVVFVVLFLDQYRDGEFREGRCQTCDGRGTIPLAQYLLPIHEDEILAEEVA